MPTHKKYKDEKTGGTTNEDNIFFVVFKVDVKKLFGAWEGSIENI